MINDNINTENMTNIKLLQNSDIEDHDEIIELSKQAMNFLNSSHGVNKY